MSRWSFSNLSVAVFSFVALWQTSTSAAPALMAPPTAVTPWYNSCYVDFAVPPGAADVRFVPLTPLGTPGLTCKYAGLAYGNIAGDGPAPVDPEIQVQGLIPGQSIKGVLQAVSCLGPVPEYNLIDMSDVVLNPNGPAPAGIMQMLGSDEGPTADGMTDSTNGQGAWTNRPFVLAQSAPFSVSCIRGPPKADPGATQFWYSEFAAPTLFAAPVETAPAATNAWLGLSTINAVQSNHVTYNVLEQGLDTYPGHTQVFQMKRHLMWVAYDGGTYDSNQPLHVAHGYIGIQPNRTFHLTPTTCLKLTWSVDSFNADGRKGVEFLIEPADDPISNFSGLDQGPGEVMNASNNVLAVRFGMENYQVTEGTGILTPATATAIAVPSYVSVDGALGQAINSPWRMRGANGRGRDDQSLLTVWVSISGIAISEDGVIGCANDWGGHIPVWLTSPSGIRFEAAAIIYHLDQCVADLKTYRRVDQYDISPTAGFPGSAENHMNLLSAQVVPISAMPPVAAQ